MVEKGKVNPVDIQLVNEVLKRHVKKRERDLCLFYQYAGQFRMGISVAFINRIGAKCK